MQLQEMFERRKKMCFINIESPALVFAKTVLKKFHLLEKRVKHSLKKHFSFLPSFGPSFVCCCSFLQKAPALETHNFLENMGQTCHPKGEGMTTPQKIRNHSPESRTAQVVICLVSSGGGGRLQMGRFHLGCSLDGHLFPAPPPTYSTSAEGNHIQVIGGEGSHGLWKRASLSVLWPWNRIISLPGKQMMPLEAHAAGAIIPDDLRQGAEAKRIGKVPHLI